MLRSSDVGYMSLMGGHAAMRLQSKERLLMQAYDQKERRIAKENMGSRVEELHSTMHEMEARTKLMEYTLGELKEKMHKTSKEQSDGLASAMAKLSAQLERSLGPPPEQDELWEADDDELTAEA